MTSQRRILVVDDEEDVRRLLISVLEISYEVDAVGTGLEAVAVATTAPPSLVVLDIDLPDISGVEVARRLRASEAAASVPILVLTGTARAEIAEECAAAGVTDFLRKPVRFDVLEHRIHALLSNAAARTA